MLANSNQTFPKPRGRGHVPPGSQVTVTIGRNVGTEPMRRADWHDFSSMVSGALRDLFRPVATFGPFEGEGEWDGTTETSQVHIVITVYPASVDAVDTQLGKVAAMFGQDAIAWSYGPNLLAGQWS